MKPLLRPLKALFLLSLLGTTAFHVRADAAKPDEQNLIVNGDFEQLKQGPADGWTVLEGTFGSTASFPSQQGRGNTGCIDIKQSGKKGAYLAQWVTLESHQNYRLSMQAEMTGGKLTFAVGATGLNVRMYGEPSEELPMSPLFWDESWLTSVPFVPGQWREVSMDFNSAGVTKVLVSLGGFFTKGDYYFDDVKLVKIAS